MYFLGVEIFEKSRQEAQKQVAIFLSSDEQHRIFTPNPEMIVDAEKDEEFRRILNTGSLNICDGMGIALFAGGKVQRIPGVDFMFDVCALCQKLGNAVYFLGSGDKEVLHEAVKTVERVFPELKVVGSHPGNDLVMRQEHKKTTKKESKKITNQLVFDKEKNDELLAEIIQAGPDVLFVGFGHNKQERWIDQFLAELPSVKLAMGVGGSFDYIAGKVQRAPRWMRTVGLEWFFRLTQEPQRFPRIFKATIGFLWVMIQYRRLKIKG